LGIALIFLHVIIGKAEMRISVIGPVYPYRGGIAHYTTALINAMQQLGHTVQTISFQRQYPGWLYPGKSDKDPSQYSSTFSAEFVLDPLNPITWQHAISKIIEFAPQLVVVQWWTTFWAPAYGIISCRLKRQGLKVIYLVHNVLPHESRRIDIPLASWAFSTVDTYLVQTDLERQRLIGVKPNAKIAVHPHPVYEPLHEPTCTKTEAREKLGLSLQAPIILFFGLVRTYKGLHVLIESLSLLKQHDLNPQLIVAGEIWGREDYVQHVQDLNLVSQVKFDNRYIPDELVPLYFNAADLFVAPYLNATQSGAVKLALGYGLPVIMTKAVATDPDMYENPNIKIIPVNDPAALAETIHLWLAGIWRPKPVGKSDNNWNSLVEEIIRATAPA